MIKKFLTALLIFVSTSVLSFAGDTGTYKIDKYTVKLTPHSDGNVTIDYYQKWSVTGGYIPWITVGVPNGGFLMVNKKGAVKAMSNGSGGGWSGVRLDLDKSYKPGESFEVGFTVEQGGLFYATDKEFKLDFTPGWYDNAFIGELVVTMNVAAKTNDVKVSPAPTSRVGQEITWVKKDVGKGARFKTSMSFPKSYMPNYKVKTAANSDSGVGLIIIIIIAVIIVIVIIVWLCDDGYSGGGIGYGGGGGGGSAILDGLGDVVEGIFSGGGGGFGGSSGSCACACVSCACACACAGGGGAGCSKKLQHSCPVCKGKNDKTNLHNTPASIA